MPKSLDVGASKSVQIKCPEFEKTAIVESLRQGETLSALTRELWRGEVAKRQPKNRATRPTRTTS
jgi:hypothetical protein